MSGCRVFGNKKNLKEYARILASKGYDAGPWLINFNNSRFTELQIEVDGEYQGSQIFYYTFDGRQIKFPDYTSRKDAIKGQERHIHEEETKLFKEIFAPGLPALKQWWRIANG